jgi:hypothetical protein
MYVLMHSIKFVYGDSVFYANAKRPLRKLRHAMRVDNTHTLLFMREQ